MFLFSPVLARAAFAGALVALACAPASAHEFWIEPVDPSPAVGDALRATLHTGQNLSADPSSWDPDRFERLALVDAAGEREVDAEPGARPAVDVPVREPGLQTLAGETSPLTVRYPGFEKFEAFLEREGVSGIAERHVEGGLPMRDIVERYTRHAKALVMAGDASGEAPGASERGVDRALGLELELVALDDPFAAEGTPLRFELLLDGAPLADVQVALFHRTGPNPGSEAGEGGPPEGVSRALARTGTDGRVAFEPPGAGTSLVSAVLVRRPSPRTMLETGALWESLWASLTFVRD